MTKHYQYIIIGAGSAGLQLAKALLQLPETLVTSILLLEANQQHEEKSWCFWYGTNHPYRHLVKKEWEHIAFIADDITIEQSIAPNTYQYINSLDFYISHLTDFKKDNRISVVYDVVDSIIPQNKQHLVVTSQANYTCDYVFYTNPLLGNPNLQPPNMWQHFLGWMIETDHPVFDTNKARMMDFSVDNTKDVQFVYILPFTDRKALVECTIFSQAIYDQANYEATLANYLQNRLPCPYQIVSKEHGKIPMQLYQAPIVQHPTIIPIGTAAGCIKPSSGYSFVRVMLHTQEIIAAIKAKQPITPRFCKPRFSFYDKLFLSIIETKPWAIKPIFIKLFRYNNINTVLRFLDEQTTLFQDSRIFASLPKLPFLKAWLKR